MEVETGGGKHGTDVIAFTTTQMIASQAVIGFQVLRLPLGDETIALAYRCPYQSDILGKQV
jgi:hypothetical protein